MAKAAVALKKKRELIPNRTTRLHNKSTVPAGGAAAKLFTVLITYRKPETFAAVLLSEEADFITVRRKKGYGSSKVLETMISKSDIIEITGEGVGSPAIVRAVADVQEVKLQHQKVKRSGAWLVCTDIETGEISRINTAVQYCNVAVTGEDSKDNAPKGTGAKTSNVTKLRKSREV